MKNKTLSQNDIDFLFQFCAKHGVKYYDVQVELVDHLASAIETEMANNPNLSFDDCLQNEYKSFGKVGFSKLLSERKIAIEKGIKKKRVAILKKSFTPPILFLTLAILALAAYLIYHHDITNINKVNLVCLIIDLSVGVYWLTQTMIYRKERKKVSTSGQRLKIMIEDIPQVWQATFLIPIVFNNLQAWVQFVSYSKGNGSFYLIATYLMLNTIGSFVLILFTQENKKIHYYTKNQYPEAFHN